MARLGPGGDEEDEHGKLLRLLVKQYTNVNRRGYSSRGVHKNRPTRAGTAYLRFPPEAVVLSISQAKAGSLTAFQMAKTTWLT